ncbi:MAG TPA: 4-hydroxy-3-methylbut-2-en-1-yl diphosphate synthase, partial [Candidatus Hydrogenedentes bacterium]|nr:4-hydroxy-3-methylbut-2-en-1-yl diphosphate synthase [Candidatus Hydrogenedentota bacterium]
SKAANIGISLPGNGETPVCPVFVDGQKACSLSGDIAGVTERFLAMVEDYVRAHYPGE